jgi:hypothetical protein
VVLLTGIGGLLSNFLGAGVGTSQIYPIGNNKLRCIVVSQPNTDIPVYSLRKENNEGRARTLHRNLLLPIGYIRDVPTPVPRKLLKRPPIPAKRTTREKIKELEHPHTDDHTTEIPSSPFSG